MNIRQRRTIERRMTHRSRSAATITTLIVLIAALALVATEAVLAAAGMAPLLLSPARLAETLRTADAGIVGGAALGLALIGILLVVLALTPGRRARRVVADERSVIVADDAVIAGALSRAAAEAARIAPTQVRTALSRRRAHLDVQPTSGFPVSVETVRPRVADLLAGIAVVPSPAADIAVAAHGRTVS